MIETLLFGESVGVGKFIVIIIASDKVFVGKVQLDIALYVFSAVDKCNWQGTKFDNFEEWDCYDVYCLNLNKDDSDII